LTDTSRLLGYIKRLKSQLPYLPWALGIVWRAAPLQFASLIVFLFINSLTPLILVFLSREIVNNLLGFSDLNFDLLAQTSLLLLFVLLLMVLNNLLQLGISYVRTAQAEYIRDYLMKLIHQKTISLDLSFFDSENYYNMLYRSYVDAIDKPARLVSNLGDLLMTTFTLIGMFLILASYALWLPFVLLLGAIPVFWVLLSYTLSFKTWRDDNTSKERRSQYLNWLLVDRQAAPELRLFALGEHYKGAYEQLRQSLRDGRLLIERKKLISQILAIAVSSIGVIFVLAWMGLQVLAGLFSIGDFAVFFQILSQGQVLVNRLMSNATEIYQNILFIENLYTFLQLENHLEDRALTSPIVLPLQEGIRFENVTFSYPDSARPVIQNFNWEIPANAIVALIGENGEGKSTLLKLLCRFYDPDEGRILWDGIDMREMSLQFVRQNISVLFQEPMHYAETAYDNIALSNLAKAIRLKDVEAASQSAGSHAFVQALPKQYDTLLGRWFGGEELSVGQWQRLALARTFLKNSDILILDEPTSAMDAWAEADFLQRFKTVSDKKTTIMITHRFTTAIYADRIDLMENGAIIESGSHSELLALNGRYAQAWYQQTREKNEEE
jgi:ATP-binding cassette, subfamily B, bacterial